MNGQSRWLAPLYAFAVCFAATASLQAAAQTPANPPSQAQPPNPVPQKPDDPKAHSRKRVVSDLSGFDLLGSGKQPTVVGATRSVTRPVALAPRLGRIYGLMPVFFWSYDAGAENAAFVLEDDAQKELFRTQAHGRLFRYPAGAPRLEPGKTYFWRVAVPLGMLGTVESDPVGFVVLSPAERAEVEKALAAISSSDPFQQALDHARLLTERRLWYDAIAAYTDLIAGFPDRAVLYEERGTIYAQIEATRSLSDQDFARADTLTPARP